MPESAVSSAENEPWWSEFVEAYGTVPLRELARRFGTNPRRLRRAAQRSGLLEEPASVRENLERLGKAPDASIADELGVTPEVIKGARARRDIAPFDPNVPPVRPKRRTTRPPRFRPPEEKRVRAERFRPNPEAVEVVRRAAPTVERKGNLPSGVSLDRALGALPPPPPGNKAEFEEFARRRIRQSGERLATTLRELEPEPERAPEPAKASPVRRRRRIVSSERLEEVMETRQEEPEPQPRPQRRKAAAPPPVRTLFDREQDKKLPEQLAEALEEVVEPPPQPRAVVRRRRAPAPTPAPAPAPVVQAAPPKAEPKVAPQAAAPAPAPRSAAPKVAGPRWRAQVGAAGGDTEVIVEAPDLAQAIQQASQLGPLRRIEQL
ncbi:MAG: hypothetical protein H6741_04475 [Alphaproteobacteria bacterium]|nr:hypothetical protein [Alphaproteobacteria bacterium]